VNLAGDVCKRATGAAPRKPQGGSGGGGWAGFALAAGSVLGGFVGWKLRRAVQAWRRSKIDQWRDEAGLIDLQVGGETYEPGERLCLPGESPDRVEAAFEGEGDAPGGDDEEGPDDGPGADTRQRRGGASRRVARRIKVVQRPYAGGQVCTGYLGSIVAEARYQLFARAATADNVSRARGYLSRKMAEHGMRSAHIEQHLDMCVVAVFEVREHQIRAEKAMALGRSLGRIRDGSTVY